jgi:hypothetical protein
MRHGLKKVNAAVSLCYDPAVFSMASELVSARGIIDSARIFISHSSKDDDFVKELRTALESHRLPVGHGA